MNLLSKLYSKVTARCMRKESNKSRGRGTAGDAGQLPHRRDAAGPRWAGFSFDDGTRRLSGTPVAEGRWTFTGTALSLFATLRVLVDVAQSIYNLPADMRAFQVFQRGLKQQITEYYKFKGIPYVHTRDGGIRPGRPIC